MFKRLMKNQKAQNTAEYAILISIVVAGIIAMQTYAQRALQGRVRDASKYLVEQTDDLGNTTHYEPYYLETNYLVSRNENDIQKYDNRTTSVLTDSNRTRNSGGYQYTTYNTTRFRELTNGV